MPHPKPVKGAFDKSGGDGSVTPIPPGQKAIVIQAINDLFEELSGYKTEASIATEKAENHIKACFEHFLRTCGFHMALEEFDTLLKEKSLGRRFRNDGTIGWYHEFKPILYFLDLVRDGKEKNGINLEDLEKYGGLETALITHMRHDSVEDTGISFDDFHVSLLDHIIRLEENPRIQDIPFNSALAEQRIEMLVSNVRLMTRKVAKRYPKTGEVMRRPNGSLVKMALFRNTTAYMDNMVHSETANPVVYCLKLLDGITNLTLIGSEKFTADRRHKYCTEREDMYGPRRGFTNIAIRQWPEFAGAIQRLDDLMGAQLYTNIGYLEFVDQYYPDKHKIDPTYEGDDREPNPIYAVDIDRYLERALSFNVPRAFSEFHTNLDRMLAESEHNPRTMDYLVKGIAPGLSVHAEKLPEYFEPANVSSAPALPKRAAYAPSI